jgi:amino acid transporter
MLIGLVMNTIKNADTIWTIVLVLGLMMLSLLILTAVGYWLFLEHRIKNKKKILSFLEPKYKIIVYTTLYCTVINFVLALIVGFTTTIETLQMILWITQCQFIAYLIFLLVPRIFVFCLQISIRKEEKEEKIKFLEALKLFWSLFKKTN